MDTMEKRKVVGVTFVTEDYISYEHNYKFCMKQKIERTIYRALILSCGHTVRIEDKTHEKLKTTRCVSCFLEAEDEGKLS